MPPTDEYAISLAKTEYREGYNTGDVGRILNVIADSFTNMSEGEPTFYGAEGKESLRVQAAKLFGDYFVKIEIIMIRIMVFGDLAHDHGCHKLILTPKRGGKTESRSYRYSERWRRLSDGAWKIELFISNRDLEPQMLAG